MQETMTSLGADFARAVAAKDFDRLREMMHPELDFRAVTPRKFWEADDPAALIANVMTEWFKDTDEIEALEHLETDAFADRERVGYRLRVRRPEGMHLVEQQAYLSERDGRIAFMRVACSGYRPIAD